MWRLAEDTLGPEDLEALADWLGGNPQLTQGPLVREFEESWSRWNGNQASVMVSSGSTANLALVTAVADRVERAPLRIGAAAVTWPTNVTPGLMLGHQLVLLDVDSASLGIDPEQACMAMEAGDIDVLFVTHLLGFNALTEEMVQVASDNNVRLLEDCCEAHGARAGETKVGTRGLGSTFSFYFGHHMSTVEGGMVSTDDISLADRLRMVRNHGLARSSESFDLFSARNPNIDRRFLFMLSGMNYRSTDINAFLGLRQLDVLDERIAQRNTNLKQFLEAAPDWIWKDYNLDGASSFALPMIAVDQRGHETVMKVLRDLDIEARPIVAGNLRLQPFLRDLSQVTARPEALPVANHIHNHGTYVGNGHHVTADMVSTLCETLRKAR